MAPVMLKLGCEVEVFIITPWPLYLGEVTPVFIEEVGWPQTVWRFPLPGLKLRTVQPVT